jgi:hypothetical protein
VLPGAARRQLKTAGSLQYTAQMPNACFTPLFFMSAGSRTVPIIYGRIAGFDVSDVPLVQPLKH